MKTRNSNFIHVTFSYNCYLGTFSPCSNKKHNKNCIICKQPVIKQIQYLKPAPDCRQTCIFISYIIQDISVKTSISEIIIIYLI